MKKTFSSCALFISIVMGYAQRLPTEQIDQLLDGVASDSTPGISLAVLKGDQLIYSKQLGIASLEYDVPINEYTKFPLASISKQFTAACIGLLVKAEKLSVNDDVRKYIPELPDYGESIKIKHLLNHTSGLRNHNVLLDLKGFDYAYSGYTNQSIESLIFKQYALNHVPGEKMLYSNSNYVLLALIVQRVAKKGLADFAEEELFQPLGLSDTFFESSLSSVVKNPAYAYYKSNGTYQQHHSSNLCTGAGGVVTTITDLLEWSKIYWQGDHPKSWLSGFLTTQDTLNNGSISNYGRGVFLDDYIHLPTIRHGGRGHGLRTIMLVAPEEHLAVVAFANSSQVNVSGIAYQVLDWLFPENNKPKHEASLFKHKKKCLNQIVGDYQEMNSDMGMKIFLENDTLKSLSSMGRHVIPLLGIQKNTFQRISSANVRHTFFDDKNQPWDMTVDFGGATFYFEKVSLADPATVAIDEYLGNYYSQELDVLYRFTTKDNVLVLDYPNNHDVMLRPRRTDEFGSGRRTRYTFYRNDEGEICNLHVAAEGTVKDVAFVRVSDADRPNP
ncbi:MAG: serine hydrolase domain-containing protein [Bacteroidota bacterium]